MNIDPRAQPRIKGRRRELFKFKKMLEKALFLTKSCQQSSNLNANLINDLVDFAQTERFCFKISKQVFDLVETINNSLNVLAFETNRKKIDVEFKFDHNCKYFN
jgi:signal transduction histidine kinase